MSNNSPTWLLDHQKSVYSQSGEDGVIEKILETLPTSDKWCVEFGAWDGLHLTNTRNLIENQQYSAVLIEADIEKFKDLERNYNANADVHPMHGFVGFDQKDNLDTFLAKTEIPKDFDFLSIDIDGNDYHVWAAMREYQPKALVIEYNPTIPNECEFVQAADPNVHQGTSLLSLVKLGKSKGYELVCAMQLNAFFVKREYFDYFGIESNEPRLLRQDLSFITYVYVGYDGELFFTGNKRLPWHDMEFNPARLQPLPKSLRQFVDDYSFFQKVQYALVLAFHNPQKLARKLKEKLPFLGRYY